MTKERLQEIREFVERFKDYPQSSPEKELLGEIDAIQNEYKEYKNHYDKIFAESVVIKTLDYINQVDENHRLKEENQKLKEALKKIRQCGRDAHSSENADMHSFKIGEAWGIADMALFTVEIDKSITSRSMIECTCNNCGNKFLSSIPDSKCCANCY